MPIDLPDFIIIGAMKCGTSTLHEQLARQPGIFMSEPKEPNFFSNDEIYARGTGWYRAIFANAGTAVLRGESSTHYTKLPTYPNSAQRMHALVPNARLIYLMRHPIDRLVSHYIHEWSMRVIDAPIERALDLHPELITYGCYHLQLRPFIRAYGATSVLPVFLERLQAAPQAELERICRFLGYPGTPRWIEDLAPQNVSADRLRLGSTGRAILYNPVLRALRRAIVPKGIREAVKARLSMGARPDLSAATRERIGTQFDADLAQLGSELGIALNCTNFKTSVRSSQLEWTPAAWSR